jgi:NAD(P)-dependent dehydrogenase (short-subunit alcohol dehydrogenase family)
MRVATSPANDYSSTAAGQRTDTPSTQSARVNREIEVAIADIECDQAVEAAESLGAQTLPVAVDVRDPESVEAAAHATAERFDGIDVAVNNAGIVKNGVSWELPLDDWHAVLDVNLWGVIHGIRSFVPRILASGGEGHVVNIASVAAVLPFYGTGPYCAAKHAVLGLSDVLRAELAGTEVGVSAVMPGLIHTPMTSVRRRSRHRRQRRHRRNPQQPPLCLHRLLLDQRGRATAAGTHRGARLRLDLIPCDG